MNWLYERVIIRVLKWKFKNWAYFLKKEKISFMIKRRIDKIWFRDKMNRRYWEKMKKWKNWKNQKGKNGGCYKIKIRILKGEIISWFR